MNVLIPLGTGAGKATAFRNCNKQTTSNVIQLDNGKMVLIDCGDGILNALTKMGTPLKNIEAIFITHLHSDHVGGIISFLFNFVLESCHVFAPKGLNLLIETFKFISQSTIPPSVYIHELEFVDAENIATLSNGIKVSAVTLPHEIQSFGFIFLDKRGLVVGILGDTKGRELSQLHKVHVLVHECTYGMESTLKYMHSNPKIAAECAESVFADYLLLTHFSPRYQTLQSIQKETAKFTDAEVVILNDFQPFDLKIIDV
ncbi:zinc phosphodiesterase, putative [Entamoeba invadens IP1]|uniref:Zinc phosphodiesterase, putative n=1 Tax=Entamoeba invadens IP1 TaxID=370355 RepID=A0A0A1U5B1_ENTIV|nr:zinc phosphodiesterase, putative [Entamoeba invadens IP1]ELP86951.1 zinc phosphodiesterase, putative [Entamoeba invadens IP1]|eukprot:XP_004253722.1 zinc phosphodiesterase, putative [Entamoeba invadens IP1]